MNWQSLLLWLALTPGIAHAQVALGWQTVDAGGATSTGGSYTLVGALGQPYAGMLNGGTYSLAGGFWGGVVQTPGAPVLSIHKTATDIVLSWPTSSVNYQLQQNMTLSIAAWSAVVQTRTTNAGRIFVTIFSSPGSRFYRLKSE